jgi:hypothetical protein
MTTFSDGNATTQTFTSTAEIGALTGRDSSGFEIFSAGATGVAHDIAHQMLDKGEHEAGYQMLGAWLDAHDGQGSEWVHMQWHMGVFELALGYWDAAFARFHAEILPAAVDGEDALTDAPAMLWRLALAAPRSVELPWEAVRRRALESMERPSDPYVELHHLLALAGAGDLDGLDRWLSRRDSDEPSHPRRLVTRMAVALRAYAAGDYARAGWELAETVPDLSEVGGSRAQNELFADIEKDCWRRV